MLKNNQKTFKHLSEFNVFKIIKFIRKKSFNSRKKDTCKAIIDTMFVVSCQIEENVRIITPDLLPLMIELVFSLNDMNFIEKYSGYLIKTLKDPINAAYFATRGCVGVLIDILPKLQKKRLVKLAIYVLSRIIRHHISPFDLRRMIEYSITGQNSLKVTICKILSKAATFSFSSQCIPGISNPTKYISFAYNKRGLSCKLLDGSNLIPKREFSVFMWVFFNKLNDAIIFEMSDNENVKFTIGTKNKKIYTKFIVNKTHFSVKWPQDLIENQWNLIGVSIRKISKIIGSKDEMYINLNNHCKLANKLTQNTANFSYDFFNKISIGKSL